MDARARGMSMGWVLVRILLCFQIRYQRVFIIITDKAKLVGEEAKGVGVMKDEEIKLEEIESSHTLGRLR